MDLSTLPAEMIARIAKYMKHVELVKLRKINVLFATSIERYGVCKWIPVKKCWLCLSGVRLLLLGSVSRLYNFNPIVTGNNGHLCELTPKDWQQMDQVLKKIKMDELIVEYFETRLEAMQAYAESFKNCQSIHFPGAQLTCSKDEFANFLNVFPKAVKLTCEYSEKKEFLLNYKFLSSRKWVSVSVNYYRQFECPDLDDRVLSLIVQNRTTLTINNAKTRFTVKGVARALKTLSSEGKSIGRSSWGILNPGERNTEQVVELLRAIPGIEIEFDRIKQEVMVRFERDPTMAVQFCFVTADIFDMLDIL